MIFFIYPLLILIAAVAVFTLSSIGTDELRERIGSMQIYKSTPGSLYLSFLPTIFIATVPLWIGPMGRNVFAICFCGGLALLGLIGTYYSRRYRVIVNCHQVTIVGFSTRQFHMSDIARTELCDSRYNRGFRIWLHDGTRFLIPDTIAEYDALCGAILNGVRETQDHDAALRIDASTPASTEVS